MRDEGRLSYHPELAAGVNFLSGTQALQVSLMFSHRAGPADLARTRGTRVVAAERGQWAGAAPDLRLTLFRSDAMRILNHAEMTSCHSAQLQKMAR